MVNILKKNHENCNHIYPNYRLFGQFPIVEKIWPKKRMITILRSRHWIQIQHNTSNYCAKFHLIWRIINFGSKFAQRLLWEGPLRHFWSFSPKEWGEGGRVKKLPLPKMCCTYPTMMKFGTVIPYLKKIQKIYESHDTPLEFCWHQHLFTGNQQNLLYQEIQI